MKNITRPVRNVNSCPHHGQFAHIIKTSGGKHVVMCDECHQAMLADLGDQDRLAGMQRSFMTPAEIAKMQYERENMALEIKLALAVEAAYLVAGYPQHLALPAPASL